MIGVDTNVLVRYIMLDEPAQASAAIRLLESFTSVNRGFVPLVAMMEMGWVLSKSYELNREQVAQAYQRVLGTRELTVENAEVVWRALRMFVRSKADLADCLIERSAHAAGCDQTVTFDCGAVRECGMTLIET